MKTKLLAVLVTAVLMFSLIGTFVLANNNDEDDSGLNIAGQVSDDSAESTNVFLDTIKMKTTFNKEKKAEIAMKIADKRALKAGQFAEKGKHEKAKELVEKHKQAMENAEEAFDELAVNGNEEDVKKALKATVRMQVKLDAHKEKYTSVHSKILERQSDKMDEEKLAHLEEVFSKIEERWAVAEERIAQKQENLISRYKVLTEATDEEIAQMLEDFKAEFQQETEEGRQARIQEKEELIKQQKEDIRERIKQKAIQGDVVNEKLDSIKDKGIQVLN